ncbi:Threonine/homoserine/homoserine lactone efflux protein [Frateuria terrea]|uniref:Threonine/homoserine/homoserine lactone efflux protein n=2 Tax=Frateuria terrea TaxID=529704 RepID=A0A1H6QVX6_9GAMM|nr:Threonine/homoserine/homoserine lactone efflux protein [Frateuria terrea]SFP13674.1 Threonine/homoserine/homoserine lactone efflux protein [Frateuria terrea]
MQRNAMHDLLAPAGLLFAAAITPGPNNLVVLRESGRGGVRGAAGAIGGIVLGGLALFAIAAAGAGTVLATHATLRTMLGAAGALYMAWLGLCLLGAGTRGASPQRAGLALPAGALGLFGFQFLNPKGWVMVLALVAAWPATSLAGYLPLALLFIAIPSGCLLLWSLAGRLLAAHMAQPRSRRRIDAAMGALLLASAVLLFVDLGPTGELP